MNPSVCYEAVHRCTLSCIFLNPPQDLEIHRRSGDSGDSKSEVLQLIFGSLQQQKDAETALNCGAMSFTSGLIYLRMNLL